MSYNIQKCAIPSKYCGDGPVPTIIKDNIKYIGKGTAGECMKKGFGIGMYTEKTKSLPALSLQRIKYVGEVHDGNFRSKGVTTTTQLLNKMRPLSTTQKESFLHSVLTKKGGDLDKKAYNSVIVFLYSNGINSLPVCSKI